LNIEIEVDVKRNKKLSEVYPEAKLSQKFMNEHIKLKSKVRHNAQVGPKEDGNN
jgi:hypothetical protein